jgi:hypothetical protein
MPKVERAQAQSSRGTWCLPNCKRMHTFGWVLGEATVQWASLGTGARTYSGSEPALLVEPISCWGLV